MKNVTIPLTGSLWHGRRGKVAGKRREQGKKEIRNGIKLERTQTLTYIAYMGGEMGKRGQGCGERGLEDEKSEEMK
jgi:hypothetical protein